MKTNIQTKLSIMMFLQFFVWGAWYTSIGIYMGKHGMPDLTHWPYTVNPIAAIIAPFFLGLVADRYFATEKVLGVLHIFGGITMLIVPMTTAIPGLFIGLLLLYNLCYMPTLGLSNSLAFHHIEDQEKQFPLIRVFGTVGWIVAGLVISYVLINFTGGGEGVKAEETSSFLYMTGIVSIMLGLFSFTLPHTPPKGANLPVSARSIMGIDAFKKLGSPSFYVFVIASLLICIPLAAYYNFTQIYMEKTGFEKIAATQTWGQVSEVFFMLLIPFFFRKLGVKWMLIIGMAAWVLRYLLFAMAAPESVTTMIFAGIVLHGVCYDFFFVTGQIYVDKKSEPEIRGQAQGFLVLITYGVGMLIGAQITGKIFNSYLQEGESNLSLMDWQQFWYIPAGLAAGVLLFFALAFREKVKP